MGTGAAFREAAQTGFWCRFTTQAANSHCRRGRKRKGRPRRRREYVALPSREAGRNSAVLSHGGGRRSGPAPSFQRRTKQGPGAAWPTRRPSRIASRRPHERGAHAGSVGTRPCSAASRPAIQPASPKLADSCLHRAACREAAKIGSLGRLSEVVAHSCRRWAPTRKWRPRSRCGYAALSSRAAGRDAAGLPEGGRLRFAPGPPVQNIPFYGYKNSA